MVVTICIPTLSRYDLLQKCIESIDGGEVRPDYIYIIDNGNKLHDQDWWRGRSDIVTFTPGYNLGVAASWNYFIQHTVDIRIFCNDDILFYPETLKVMLEEYEDDKLCFVEGSGFSLFFLSDKVIKKVGMFDEDISPGYAYFEDNDYQYRAKLAGVDGKDIQTRATHFASATLKALTPEQLESHHRKFNVARAYYYAKWGGGPREEVYLTPWNE